MLSKELRFCSTAKKIGTLKKRNERIEAKYLFFDKLTEKFSLITISTFLRILGSAFSEFYYYKGLNKKDRKSAHCFIAQN